MVRNIDGCIDPFQEDKILFYPFAKSKILDVDVSSTTGRFLSIGHSRASVVVFVCDCGSFLWNVEVPQNTADIKANSTHVRGGHELGLG